jgi:hypothetical protein
MKEMVQGAIGVTILGRAGLRYRDGSKTAFIDCEVLAGPVDLVVYVNTIKAWEDNGQAIGDDVRKGIVANLQSIFRQNGLSVDFE